MPGLMYLSGFALIDFYNANNTTESEESQCYCTFVPPLLLLMTHHEKMWLNALP